MRPVPATFAGVLKIDLCILTALQECTGGDCQQSLHTSPHIGLWLAHLQFMRTNTNAGLGLSNRFALFREATHRTDVTSHRALTKKLAEENVVTGLDILTAA